MSHGDAKINTSYWGARATSHERSPALDVDLSRWLNTEGQAELKNEAAFPFSTGHRMCLGKKFAEVEMRAMAARFFSQFLLCPEPNKSDIVEA